MKLINFLLARLKEKSTWVALLTVVGTIFGVQISPEFQNEIITAGLAIVSLVLFMMKGKK